VPLSTPCLLLELLIHSNPCLIRLPCADIAATVFANWHCLCPLSLIRLPCEPHCYCYWLANYLVRYLPLDACASVDVLTLFLVLTLYYCIIVLTCMIASLHTVYNEYWLFPFSPPPSLHVLLLYYWLGLYHWLALLNCIIDLSHCIVLLSYCIIPHSLQWVSVYFSSPHPHVCLCLYFSCRKDDYLCIITCYLHIAYCHWHYW